MSESSLNRRYYQNEQAAVKVTKFPKTSELRQWRHDLLAAVQTASDRVGEVVLHWSQEAQLEGASVDSLRNSAHEFITVGRKLAIALMVALPQSLKRKVLRALESEMSEHTNMTNGRHVLLMIYKFLSTSSILDDFYNSRH